MNQKLSPDGKWLGYVEDDGDGGAFVLNLRTLERTKIILHDGFPKEQISFMNKLCWCPQDPDLLSFLVGSYIDSNNSGSITNLVKNIFTYRPSTGELRRITPDICGKYGPVQFDFENWLPTSTPGHDSLLVGFKMPAHPQDSAFYGIYVPQTQTFVPHPVNPILVAYSKDHQHTIYVLNDLSANDSQRFYIDNVLIAAPRIIRHMYYASFSPDGKYYAITVDPYGSGPPVDSLFDQVWIGEVGKPLTEWIKVINLQCLFCKYNFWGGIDAEFVSDTSVAISMHADADISSPLWEVDINGKIVRQLTFLPLSSVPKSPVTTSIFSIQRREESRTNILKFSLKASTILSFSLTDIMGRQFGDLGLSYTYAPGSYAMPLDLSHLSSGAYFLHISSAGSVETLKLLKE